MGTLQIEFPMLWRTGLIEADPHEIIGVSLGENHVDFIYLGIFPRSLDRAIEDWTRVHVSIAMLQDKKGIAVKAEEIRTLWSKYKGLSSVLAECMQRAIGASLYDRMNMLEKEFPDRAKELNDEMKERRKNKSDTAKERKANVDRTHSTLANQRASVEKGKEESKKAKKASKHKHACHGDFCLLVSVIHMANRPKVKSRKRYAKNASILKGI